MIVKGGDEFEFETDMESVVLSAVRRNLELVSFNPDFSCGRHPVAEKVGCCSYQLKSPPYYRLHNTFLHPV